MDLVAENRSIFDYLAEKFSRLIEKIASFVLNGHDSRAVANYMLEKAAAAGRGLTVAHLLNLVYIAHGFRLGLSGRPLIRHPVEAWPLGPVVSSINEAYPPDDLEALILITNSLGVPYDADFTDAELEAMDMVFDAYSLLSAEALSAVTREPGAPWDQVKDGEEFAVIPNGVIKDYYHGLLARPAKEAA